MGAPRLLMGVYFEAGRGFRFNFQFKHQRHTSPRGFETKRDAKDAEDALRRRLKLEAAGVIVEPIKRESPTFTEWAGVYSEYVHTQHMLGRLKRPEAIDYNLQSILRFFGAKPTKARAAKKGPAKNLPTKRHDAPYHGLTLADPIDDPSWVRKFEQWMTETKVASGTRNHYTTTLSRMYWLAMQPEYRQEAGEPAYNPFRDRPRSRWKRRTVTLSPAEIERWVMHASYHARLAIAIAALAPKFRLMNVLRLEWRDVDFERRLITVWDHKTDASGQALVAPIAEQLERILRNARARHPNAKRVVLYRGRPVKKIDAALKSAATAAGLRWGRVGGVTFHSIRHAMSTLLARGGVTPEQRQGVTGRKDLTSELWYTHLLAEDARPTAERLSTAVPLELAVTSGPTRVTRRKRAG